MKQPLILVICVLISLFSKSQSKLDSLMAEDERENKEVFLSRIFSIDSSTSNIHSKTYENQGMYNSTYFILNSDSSFVYYSVYEVGFDLCLGKWTEIKPDIIGLMWEKKKTINVVKDVEQYQQYFSYSSPKPISITNWIFKKNGETLEPLK